MRKLLVCVVLTFAAVTVFANGQREAVKGQSSITYQSWTPYKETMDQIVADLKTTNPNLTVDVKMHSDFPEFLMALKVGLAAGEGPDVFAFDSPTSLGNIKTQILPIDELASKEWGPNWKDKFGSSFIADVSIDGKVMGLPMGAMPAGLIWYNKTMFDSYGIKEPKTYADLKNAADILRKNGKQPLLLGAKDPWMVLDVFQSIMNDVAPGKQYAAFDKKGKFTDPAIVKAFDMWKKLFDDGIFQDQAYSMSAYMDCYNAMNDKQSAGMWINGAWNLDIFGNKELKAKIDAVEWAVMPFPDLNGDGKVPPTASTVGGFCINSNTKDKDAAWQLLKSLGVGAGMSQQSDRFLWTPPLKDKVELSVQLSPNAAACRNTIGQIVAQTPSVPRGIPNAKVADKIYDVLAKVAFGEISGAVAAEEVQKVIDAN